MSAQRIFLDWHCPCLPEAAYWLLRQVQPEYGRIDLSAYLVVVPNRRAGRRLLELLVERVAEIPQQGAFHLRPPQIDTRVDADLYADLEHDSLPDENPSPKPLAGANPSESNPTPAQLQQDEDHQPAKSARARPACWLQPPTFVTVAELPDELIQPRRPIANTSLSRLAWIQTLRRTSTKTLARIVKDPPTAQEVVGWLTLAELLENLQRELTLEGLTFTTVLKTQKEMDYPDLRRWQVLTQIQERYRNRLEQIGVIDSHQAYETCLQEGQFRQDRQVVLVGVPTLPRLVRQMLQALPTTVNCLIQAPAAEADRFDEWGTLCEPEWQTRSIEVTEQQVHVVENPAEQAAVAIRLLCEKSGQFAAEEISIGVADEQVVPYLEQQLAANRIVSRYAAGTPLPYSGPYRLLEAVADYLERRSFAALANLLRHPDIERWLARRPSTPTAPEAADAEGNTKPDANQQSTPPADDGSADRPNPADAAAATVAAIKQAAESNANRTTEHKAASPDTAPPESGVAESETTETTEAEQDESVGRSGIGVWLTALDWYYQNHLQANVGDTWLGESTKRKENLERIHQAIRRWLKRFEKKARPLRLWMDAIEALLTQVYSRWPLRRNRFQDRRILAANEIIQRVLLEQRHGPLRQNIRVTAHEAIRVVLRQVATEMIPPDPTDAAVELLGWTELALEDAPQLIVTGFNEGRVPETINSDLFLPNQLRQHLGLPDNDRCYARDAYYLTVLLASRPNVPILLARRTLEGDPLLPSRLLFAGAAETMARRILHYFGQQAPTDWMALPHIHAGTPKSRFLIPIPKRLPGEVTDMRVTSFRDYLACPYRFYLRHLLLLKSVDDAAEELDGGSFGSLAHDVLELFGKSELIDETNAERIREFLNDHLNQLTRRRYGTTPLPAIAVQVEQLRTRFQGFAQWQAKWRHEGWRIEHIELGFEGEEAYIDVDGKPMYLRGRLDRIDVHEVTSQRIILDYKTGDRSKSPDQTHRDKGRWVDLQLPLYRFLVSGKGIAEDISLAYLVLPKNSEKVKYELADWSPTDLAEADEQARRVIQGVRQEIFWPPTENPEGYFAEFAALCQEGRLNDENDDMGERD